MEDENGLPLECTVCRIITNDKYSAVGDVYKEFVLLIEQIKSDDVYSSILENLYKHKVDCDENSRKNEKSTIKSGDRYWKILKEYYYRLQMECF